MAQLIPEYTSQFKRDVKALKKKHRDMTPLREVIELVCENTEGAKQILRQRHNAHALKGQWAGSAECHVANAGDWLLVWRTSQSLVVFQRTGAHDDIFR